MIRTTRIAALLGAIVLLASACESGDTPLSPSTRPALDGGGHTAGGNVIVTPEDPTTTSTTSTAAEEDETREGGGHTAGGN